MSTPEQVGGLTSRVITDAGSSFGSPMRLMTEIRARLPGAGVSRTASSPGRPSDVAPSGRSPSRSTKRDRSPLRVRAK